MSLRLYNTFTRQVEPFVLNSSDQFRIPPPPALTSPAYTDAFHEAQTVGGDSVVTRTQRPLALVFPMLDAGH